MIYAQEIDEKDFRRIYPDVFSEIYRNGITCINCKQKLVDGARIHYVGYTTKKVIWWHSYRCDSKIEL